MKNVDIILSKTLYVSFCAYKGYVIDSYMNINIYCKHLLTSVKMRCYIIILYP